MEEVKEASRMRRKLNDFKRKQKKQKGGQEVKAQK